MTIHMSFPETTNAPVFALHSSASSSAQWSSLVRDSEGRFDVFTPDLPIYGKNRLQNNSVRFGTESVALSVIRKIELLGRPAHIVGHSNGAGIALKIALMRPELVKSLSLFEPATFHFLKSGDAADRKYYEEIKLISAVLTASALSGRPDLGMMRFIDFWNGDGTWGRLPTKAKQNFARQTTSVMSDFANGFSESWTLGDLIQLNTPTQIMMGLESPKVAQCVSLAIAESLPNASLAMLPELGHMAPVFQPEWVNPRILSHLASVERPAREFAWPSQSAA